MSFITAATERAKNFITGATRRNKIPADLGPVVIGEEIATAEWGGLRSLTNTRSDENLDAATLYSILRSADLGSSDRYLDLADAIESSKDPQIRNLLTTRKQAVISVPLEIVSVGKEKDDEESAELVREVLSGDWMANKLFDMMDAVFKGYSVSEIIWDYNAKGQLLPVDIILRDPKWFRFDMINRQTLYLRSGFAEPRLSIPAPKDGFSGNLGDIPLSAYPNNFMIHLPKSKSGVAIRGGLAYACAYYYIFKNFSVKDWVAMSERDGTARVLAKYPRGLPPAKITAIYDMVKAMGKDMAGVFEAGIDVQFLEHVGRAASTNLYADLVRYIDDAQAKLILGQTLTSDTGQGRGSYALGAVHHAVRIDVLKADARQLAQTLNKYLIEKIINFNFGPRSRYAYARFNVRENIDVQVMANSLSVLVGLGAKIPEVWTHEYFSIPIAKPGDDILEITAAPLSNVKGGLKPADSTGGIKKPGAKPDGKSGPSEVATS